MEKIITGSMSIMQIYADTLKGAATKTKPARAG
ncbi:hypothetical protein MiSe_01960 [Microseira wollei NIES-4236]|uniref:Uncharacterized protein n=1 Tax=Microseira wollei NIES-4236 TaxID=2530354 RepID=A0AAV3WEB9_9CYAN|nr:hypothetical protein MiSe_01960 [Microseira wollei NIES-4236]